jgi:hypothetical protein
MCFRPIHITMDDRCNLGLGNNRFVRACDWRDGICIDISERQIMAMTTEETSLKCREYVAGESENDIPLITEPKLYIPMKKGISLPLGRWKILSGATEDIDEALSKGSSYSIHLGGNVYCKVTDHGVCVDIRQYWSPPDTKSIVPTKKGITLQPTEYTKLKDIMSIIEDFVPELNAVVPCYAQSDHLNQLGYLRCVECNPNNCGEW